MPNTSRAMESVETEHTPTISILMPTYNGMSAKLPEAIASVLAQSFADWELLISDDGSTDETRAYLADIKDPRIRVYCQPQNLGIFGNLNFLFGKACSPLSFILCQDDYFLTDGLAKVIAAWSPLPSEVGFIRFNWAEDGRTRCPLRRLAHQMLPRTIPTVDANLFFFIFGNLPGNLSNVSVRTALIRATGCFREDIPYAGDYQFWVRLARLHSLHLSEEDVSYVRRHEQVASITLNRRGELIRQLDLILDDLIANLTEDISPMMLRLYAHLAFDMQQWNRAALDLTRGWKTDYLRIQMQRSAQFKFALPVRFLLAVLTLGDRVRAPKVWMARRFLRTAKSPLRASGRQE